MIRGEQPKKNLFLKYLDANQELYENSNKSQENATKQETKRDNSKMEVEEDNLFPDNNDSQKEINKTKEKEEKEKEELMKLLKNPELCNARGFQLDDNVSVWSDYLNINFDQQTVTISLIFLLFTTNLLPFLSLNGSFAFFSISFKSSFKMPTFFF